jgi:5-methylcytosine-specific restriction protein A
MPIRPARLCAEPRCGRPSTKGSHYCAPHKAQAEARRADQVKATHKRYNEKRDEADAFYKTERWRKLSIRYRKLHPLCEECERHGLITPSAMTDHIKARKTHPELSLAWDNLRALCWSCHNRVGERVGLVDGRGENETAT